MAAGEKSKKVEIYRGKEYGKLHKERVINSKGFASQLHSSEGGDGEINLKWGMVKMHYISLRYTPRKIPAA
mgnify:CR=1 FL=1